MSRFDRASVALSVLSLCIVPCMVPSALKGSVQSVSEPGEVRVGITVEGTGEAEAAADTLEYGVGMVVGGETLPDAFMEYDRVVARLSKALDQLGIKGLTHARHGITLNTCKDFEHRQRQQDWSRNQNAYRAPSRCEVLECLTIRVPIVAMEEKDIHGMVVEIMGLAAELGLEDSRDRLVLYGNPGIHVPSGWQWGISYTLRDPERFYAKAVLLATEDANAKAKLQAKFIGGRLGNVVAVDIRTGGSIEPGKAMILQHRVVLRVRYDFAVEMNHGDRQ